ncbi:MAG TPA: hypothetical protein VN721_11190 [Flavipsychrobacter sp.]|nr:hypothetical protein [Flavipsychrobacter sp.]
MISRIVVKTMLGAYMATGAVLLTVKNTKTTLKNLNIKKYKTAIQLTAAKA